MIDIAERSGSDALFERPITGTQMTAPLTDEPTVQQILISLVEDILECEEDAWHPSRLTAITNATEQIRQQERARAKGACNNCHARSVEREKYR